jgi:DNA-directed RNA polymerase subunit RPC12/RpoP
MGRIYLHTLSDYHKHGFDLEVMCRACGHKAVLTPESLFARGIVGEVERVEARLRCGQCGGRALVSSTMSGPSGGRRRGRDWWDRS